MHRTEFTMGQKLTNYYEAIKAEAGFQAQMRLALRTGVSSAKAASIPDSQETLEKFKTAFKEISGKDSKID